MRVGDTVQINTPARGLDAGMTGTVASVSREDLAIVAFPVRNLPPVFVPLSTSVLERVG